jgi:hypothetical protein
MENFEYKGLWWLPERPTKTVTGTLRYTSSEGIVLELVGSFKDIKDVGNMLSPEIILGITSDGKPITLYKCFEKSSELNSPGFQTSLFHVNLVFVGAYFQDAKDIKFKSMSVYYSYLDQWVDISGFKIECLGQGKESVIKYKQPELIRADISDTLTLAIIFKATGCCDPLFLKQINIKQKTEIKIEVSEDTSFEELKKIIYHIRNFLTIATMKSVQVLNIKGTTKINEEMIDNEVYRPPVEILYRQLGMPEGQEILHPSEMFFTFNDISDRFEYFLKNWFEKSKLLEPVYNLYFATLHNPHMYLESKFLSLVQAIEPFHQYMYEGKYLSDEEYKPIYNTLVNAIPKETQKELKDRLKEYLRYGNEFSLRKRMKDIINRYRDVVDIFIKDSKSFIEKVVNTRNYLIHRNRLLGKDAASGKELYHLTQKLRICLEACLLGELGFNLHEIRDLFIKHLNYQDELIK